MLPAGCLHLLRLQPVDKPVPPRTVRLPANLTPAIAAQAAKNQALVDRINAAGKAKEEAKLAARQKADEPVDIPPKDEADWLEYQGEGEDKEEVSTKSNLPECYN